MQPTKIRDAALVGLVGAIVGYLAANLVPKFGGAIPLNWASVIIILSVTIVLAGYGYQVYAWRNGRKPLLKPILAAKILVAAKSSINCGALFFGWYLALTVQIIQFGVTNKWLISAGSALASLVLIATGFLVQNWCRVPPDSDRPELQPEKGKSDG